MSDFVGNRLSSPVYAIGDTSPLMSYLKGLFGVTGEKCVEKLDGAVLAAADPLFTITGGMILATIVGKVTTAIVGASNLRLTITTVAPAATVNLNAGAVAVDDDAAGTTYHNVAASSVFTPTTAGVAIMDPVTIEMTQFLLGPGTVNCLGSVARVGVIHWQMLYKAFSPAVRVVAAA